MYKYKFKDRLDPSLQAIPKVYYMPFFVIFDEFQSLAKEDL